MHDSGVLSNSYIQALKLKYEGNPDYVCLNGMGAEFARKHEWRNDDGLEKPFTG